MNEHDSAARDLARIRALMERAGRYSHLSGVSALVAGGLAVAGVSLCWVFDVDFNQPRHAPSLALIWSGVLAVAAIQHVAFTIANARRRTEPAWSPLTRQVAVAMLPAAFVGAAITGYGLQTGQLDLLPPIWMLAHGSSLMGLGLFTSRRVQLVAILFLILGAGTLWWGKEHGLVLMLISFGGLHLLLGAWITWKPQASAV